MPIPGPTKQHRRDENLGAASVKLTADDLRDIETAVFRIKMDGAAYGIIGAANGTMIVIAGDRCRHV